MSLHRRGRNVECVGRFFDGEPAEIPELDDLGLVRIEGGESLERGIEREHVDAARSAFALRATA